MKWFSGFRLVLPSGIVACGSVQIAGTIISDIRKGRVRGAEYEGREELILMPGFVDLHGDMIEQEISPRPDCTFPLDFALFELDKRLAFSGITTAFAAISFSSGDADGKGRSLERAVDVIKIISKNVNSLLVDHQVHARFEITNLAAAPVLINLLNNKSVHMVSFMDHTPGQGQFRDLERYIQSLSARRGISLERAGRLVTERISRRSSLQNLDEVVTEIAAKARDQGIILASHDDDTLEKIKFMAGLGVTVSEFPVTLDAAKEARRRGLYTLMGAPNVFRGKSQAGNLSARAATEAGHVSILASDYHPASMLMATMILASGNERLLPSISAMTSAVPAKAAGLNDRGELTLGKRADLIVVKNGCVPQIIATFSKGRMVSSTGELERNSFLRKK